MVFALAAGAGNAAAQSELNLGLNKDFGFAWGSQIQGKFTLDAESPDELAQVTFHIDGQVLGEDAEPPFEATFHTGDFSLGWHTLSAVATTTNGRELTSETLRLEFVSADAGPAFVMRFVLPVLAAILVLMLGSTLVPMLMGRGKFRPGHYGAAGGAVCPKCRLPFSRHVFGLNCLAGKVERCPHCGRWVIVARATPESLAAAEARLRPEGSATIAVSDEDRLRQQIDDSRFLE